MKAVLLYALIIALLSWGTQFILPWWSIALIAFVVAVFALKAPGQAFLAGCLGGILHWGLYALWQDVLNTGILSGKVGELFGGLPGVALLMITLLIGGLLGGMGGLSGAYLKLKFISK